MRISTCVGYYATTPYCIPGFGMNVYSMEELCFCLKENAFLLDAGILSDALLEWVESQCGLRDLSKELYPLVHKKGSLSAFVMCIMNYVGLYDAQTLTEVETTLKQGAGLSNLEKKKSQIDFLLEKHKYAEALRGYDALVEKWEAIRVEGQPLPAVDCLAAIWHNKGVAMAGLMFYEKAAECFTSAYETYADPSYYKDYLAAKRLAMTDKEYVAFAAESMAHYDEVMQLEREMESLERDWVNQPEYMRLARRAEQKNSSDKQIYYEDGERIARSLKDGYRTKMSV